MKKKGTSIPELIEKREKIDNEIKAIQAECSHPAAVVDIEVHNNYDEFGNYNYDQNSKTTFFYCNMCLLNWSVAGVHSMPVGPEK